MNTQFYKFCFTGIFKVPCADITWTAKNKKCPRDRKHLITINKIIKISQINEPCQYTTARRLARNHYIKLLKEDTKRHSSGGRHITSSSLFLPAPLAHVHLAALLPLPRLKTRPLPPPRLPCTYPFRSFFSSHIHTFSLSFSCAPPSRLCIR